MATLADEAGESVATIAAMLNHIDTGTVQRYVQASGVRVADAWARLRAVLRGAD